MNKDPITEKALDTYRALSFLQNNTQLHPEDKRGLIIDYVRYRVEKDNSMDYEHCSVTKRNQSSVIWRTAQANIIRYMENHYLHNAPPYLNLLFGKNNWSNNS